MRRNTTRRRRHMQQSFGTPASESFSVTVSLFFPCRNLIGPEDLDAWNLALVFKHDLPKPASSPLFQTGGNYVSRAETAIPHVRVVTRVGGLARSAFIYDLVMSGFTRPLVIDSHASMNILKPGLHDCFRQRIRSLQL